MDIINEVVKQIDINGKEYRVAVVREFDVIEITIDVEASKTTPYAIKNNFIKFSNKFVIDQLTIFSETNALAGLLLKNSGNLIPSISYYVDASNAITSKALGTYTKGFYSTTTLNHYRDLNIVIEKEGKLEFLVYNTHGSAQMLYIKLFGYRLFEKVLKLNP